MSNRLFAGNLAFHATESLIEARFKECGEVSSVTLVLDRTTGRSRGFAFVEMASQEAAEKAVAELNGQDLLGRALHVDIAEERRNSPTGGGGRSGSGGGWRSGR